MSGAVQLPRSKRHRMPAWFPERAPEKSAAEWAHELGVSAAAVYAWALRHETSCRPVGRGGRRRGSYNKRPEWFATRAHEKTAHEWARELGVATDTVLQWARRTGSQCRHGSSRMPSWFPQRAHEMNRLQWSIELRVSESTVKRWTKRTGAKWASPVRSRMPASFAEQAHEHTDLEWAEKHHVSVSTVHRWARALGVYCRHRQPVRPHSQPALRQAL